MSQYNDSGYRAFACGGAIGQYLRVKLSASLLVLCGIADTGFGVLRDASFGSGDFRTVMLFNKSGTIKMIANGAITNGSDVYAAANGKVGSAPAAGGSTVALGMACEDTSADGDVFEVMPYNFGHGKAGPITVTETATATLTNAETADTIIDAVHASVAIALTLPAAAAGNAGNTCRIGMGGAAAVTVICAAGFGGGGASHDTVTLAQGDMCICVSDGTNWYVDNVTTSA